MKYIKRVVVSWSSGKDSAWALHQLRQEPGIEVCGLVTTVNRKFERVAMHAVREKLLAQQAAAIGLPLYTVDIHWPCSNDAYEAAMRTFFKRCREDAIDGIAFGDLFLEDVRDYRLKLMTDSGLEPMFPLWGLDTHELIHTMIDGGLQAVVTCLDPKTLPSTFAGRVIDQAFVAELPDNVDPCGERGEFHTCVIDGPMLAQPLALSVGDTVERDGFVFTDLLPEADAAASQR